MKKLIIYFLALFGLPLIVFARGHRHQSPPPVVPPVASGSGITLSAYLTGYGAPDNSPPGIGTYLDGISGSAGGIGTYQNPTTLAVGYVGQTGDFAYGTIFYVPVLEKYFVAQDTCAACHSQKNGQQVHLDLFVSAQNVSGVLSCEDQITGNYQVIENPANNLPVIAGAIYQNGTCQ